MENYIKAVKHNVIVHKISYSVIDGHRRRDTRRTQQNTTVIRTCYKIREDVKITIKPVVTSLQNSTINKYQFKQTNKQKNGDNKTIRYNMKYNTI